MGENGEIDHEYGNTRVLLNEIEEPEMERHSERLVARKFMKVIAHLHT